MHRHYVRNRHNQKKRLWPRSYRVPKSILKTLRISQSCRYGPTPQRKLLTNLRFPSQSITRSWVIPQSQSHNLQQLGLLLSTHRKSTYSLKLPYPGPVTITEALKPQNPLRYTFEPLRRSESIGSTWRCPAAFDAFDNFAARWVPQSFVA